MGTDSGFDSYCLSENESAKDFHDAHLLGNGRLGASVFGGVPYETVLINHDTLWSGQEREKVNPGTRANFGRARELVMAGKLREANTLINDEMLGYWSESYMPLAWLHITLGHVNDQRGLPQRRRLLGETGKPEDYRRTLFLSEAVERISYRIGDDLFERELFVSAVDDALVIRLSGPPGKLDFSLSVDSPLRHEQFTGPGKAAVTGRAPDRVEPYEPHFEPPVVYRPDAESDSLRFACTALVAGHDGLVSCDEMRTYVRGASEAVILLGAATNYEGYLKKRNPDPRPVADRLAAVLERASAKTYAALLDDHRREYRSFYGRVGIDLGPEITGALPTSRRLERYQSIEDISLQALVLQYARYLLISFSRPGSQAGNLQGIWNPSPRPAWASNYTTNINVQMNYWCAEALGLGDCHLPLVELVKECALSGRAAAKALYGADGWVTHHNTDLWRMTTLAGENSSWSWWPFGGVWLCNHLWQHYEYTGDRDYLEEVLPVLKGAAEFIAGYVVRGEDGYYYTPPSTSPENKFFYRDDAIRNVLDEVTAENRFSESREDVSAVCRISTMDIALVTELLGNVTKALSLLGRGAELDPRIPEILKNLYPFKIGRFGQLQEWDRDYEECTPGMGHVSHLYPVYPSGLINGAGKPELFRAAYVSFLRRLQHGAARGHWPAAWALCLAARFFDANTCNSLLRTMPGNLGANLLTGKTYQIDAVMGWAAGISEILLQSHEGVIRLLPALPVSWRNGRVRGLRARGGYTVDIGWQDGVLTGGLIGGGGRCTMCYGNRYAELELRAGNPLAFDGNFREREKTASRVVKVFEGTAENRG
jgi:alpha-L-fucosidase 2